MAWAEVTAIALYPSALFDLHSDCGAWAVRVQRRFTNAAQQFAPYRYGTLRAGIHGHTTRTGPVHVVATIISSAPHTMYVIKTTGPYIYPSHSKFLSLPAYGGWAEKTVPHVSGYEGKNFFLAAAQETAFRHPSLAGWAPGVADL